MKKCIAALAAISLLAWGQTSVFASTGEVTLSGSTWTGKVDGTTKYTGSSMADAANACVAAMTLGGTINIRNSGSASTHIRLLYGSTTVNGNGCTLTGNGAGNQGIVYSQNQSSVGAQNIVMKQGSSGYGMYFSTCNGVTLSGMSGSCNETIRIDDCKGGTGYNGAVNSPNLSSCGAMGVENYGISGFTWGTVTVNTAGDCGLLLNYSSSQSGSAANGTKCDYGGGYAGFRCANNNRSTSQGTVNSTSCGRGFFSVSGSSGCTITKVNATNCSAHGIWLQSTSSTHVNSGTVKNCHPCTSISQDLGGNSISVSCQ